MKVSSEIFQRKLNECLAGLSNVVCIADDILVYGKDKCEHDDMLNKLLIRCLEKNIKLNKTKCVLNTSNVDFLSHQITNEGLKASVKKTEAISKMAYPTDIEGVRRVLGSVNYLAKFLSNLSDVVEPLRRLTHKDISWSWSADPANTKML